MLFGQPTPALLSAEMLRQSFYVTLLLLALSAQDLHGFNLNVQRPWSFVGPPDSYFGYAVTLHGNNDGEWLLVGAPRTGTRGGRPDTPGAVYKCPVTSQQRCTQMDFSQFRATEFFHGNQRFKELQDHQLLGAALDSNGEKVAMCAPLWRDTKWQGQFAVNGMCYTIDKTLDESTVVKLLLLTDASPTSQWGYSGNFFPRSFGEMGFSVHIAKDNLIVIGAPGMYDWRGDTIMYRTTGRRMANVREKPSSYVGYSLTSGRFYSDGKVYHVSGAPRSEYVGKVFIRTETTQVRTVLKGTKLGSYFGAALCAVDVNSDGRDDLLVGAPMDSSHLYDEGLVDVFIADDLDILSKQEASLRGSAQTGARFGSAIVSAGDLNLDGFPDVAIGAPYEDDGRGAIYVYNGYHEGLHRLPSQRVAASVLSNTLRGFGFTLASTKRIGNYPAVSIGAYASGEVVVLRARPVVKVTLLIEAPNSIDHRSANCIRKNGRPSVCFTVTVFSRYQGLDVPSFLSFRLHMEADIGKSDQTSRATFVESKTTTLIKTLINIRNSRLVGNNITLVLNSRVADVVTPINIKASLTLFNTAIGSPVLDQYGQHTVIKSIPFYMDCGDNDVCHSDVSIVSAPKWLPNKPYVILGDRSDLVIEVVISNDGEPAYMTEAIFEYPEQLAYKRTRGVQSNHVACAPRSHGTTGNDTTIRAIFCDVGHLLKLSDKKTFSIIFVQQRKTHVFAHPAELLIKGRVTTISNDTDLRNNEFDLSLPLELELHLDRTASSSPKVYLFTEEVYEVTDTKIRTRNTSVNAREFDEITHVYDVQNKGPGLHPAGYVDILVPVTIGRLPLIRDVTVKGTVTTYGQQTGLVCRDNSSMPQLSGGDVSAEERRIKRLVEETRTAFNMDCGSSSCRKLVCDVSPLVVDGGLTLSITMSINLTAFRNITSGGSIRLITEATINHRSDLPSRDPWEKRLTASTFIEGLRQEVGLPPWLIPVTVLVGVALLAILIGILFALGFFNRPQKEAMNRLLSTSGDEPNPTDNEALDNEEDEEY